MTREKDTNINIMNTTRKGLKNILNSPFSHSKFLLKLHY